MGKKSRRENRVQGFPVADKGNNRAAQMFLDGEGEQETVDFPMMPTSDHLTGEIYDPSAQMEQ